MTSEEKVPETSNTESLTTSEYSENISNVDMEIKLYQKAAQEEPKTIKSIDNKITETNDIEYKQSSNLSSNNELKEAFYTKEATNNTANTEDKLEINNGNLNESSMSIAKDAIQYNQLSVNNTSLNTNATTNNDKEDINLTINDNVPDNSLRPLIDTSIKTIEINNSNNDFNIINQENDVFIENEFKSINKNKIINDSLKMSSIEQSTIEKQAYNDLINEIDPKESLINNDSINSANITEMASNITNKDMINEIEFKASLTNEESTDTANMTENTLSTLSIPSTNITQNDANTNIEGNKQNLTVNNNYEEQEKSLEANKSCHKDDKQLNNSTEYAAESLNEQLVENSNTKNITEVNVNLTNNNNDKDHDKSSLKVNSCNKENGKQKSSEKGCTVSTVEIKCEEDCDALLDDVKEEIVDDDNNVPDNFLELAEHFLTNEARVVLQRIVVYKCPQCPRVFTSSGQRALHKAKHVNQQVILEKIQPENTDERFTKRYECPECDFRFVQESTLQAHMVIHRPYPHVCDCGIGYTKQIDLEQHEKLVHNKIKTETTYTSTWKPIINLKKTKRSEINRKRLNKQLEAKEPTPEPTYSRYGRTQKRFVTIREQSPNLEYSSDDLDDETMFQPKKKKAKYKLKTLEQIQAQQERQIKKENKENKIATTTTKNENASKGPFICSICDRELKTYRNYERHLLSHSNLRNFKCLICEKAFNTDTGLRNHQQIHLEAQFKCNFCDKTFNTKHNRKTHENIHMGIKKYVCGYCEKSFTDPSALKRHERIHTGVKPYKCQYCPKAFSDASAAIVHRRRHEGKKKFACRFCEKTFVERQGITSHEKLHLNNFKFQCDLCSAKFQLKYYLVFHIQSKHGFKKDRYVKCSTCNKEILKVNMAKHKLSVHGIKIKKKKKCLSVCAPTPPVEIEIDIKNEIYDP